MTPIRDQLFPSKLIFWRLAPTEGLPPACFSGNLYSSFPWHRFFFQDSRFLRARLRARNYWGNLAHHLLSCIFLFWNIISSLGIAGATTIFLTSQINSIKDQLKLAGAATGVPGNPGHSWMPIYSSLQFRFYPMRLVVTNPAVPDGTFLLLVSFSYFIFNGSVFLGGLGSTLLIPLGPVYKVLVSSISQSSIIAFLDLMLFLFSDFSKCRRNAAADV